MLLSSKRGTLKNGTITSATSKLIEKAVQNYQNTSGNLKLTAFTLTKNCPRYKLLTKKLYLNPVDH